MNEQYSEESAIFSKWAIIGFCVFFSPFFGGMLLRSNLRTIGQKATGNLMIPVTLMMSALTALTLTTPIGGAGVTFTLNLIQGAMLTEFVFRKYFPDADQRPVRPAGRAFMVALLVVMLLMLLLTLLGQQVPVKP